MEWRKPGEIAPRKAKTRISAGKVLATFFWNDRAILLVDFLHERRTVNSAYYCQLRDEVKLVHRRKRRHMSILNAILLPDNARPHTAALTQEKLDKIHWKTLEHPPYSPDLSSRDYYIFGPLKEELENRNFDDDDVVKTFVRNWLQTPSNSFFDDGI